MPPRSKITKLPAAVRNWLDAALVEGNFSGYEALADDLKGRGYEIGKSALHRHGQWLEHKISAIKASTEAAKIIVQSAPDQADARSEALLSLVQHELFTAINSLKQAETEDDVQARIALIGKAAKGIADVVRASAVNKRLAREVAAEALNKAAERVDEAARAQGLSKEQADFWRGQVLGAL